MFSKLFNGIEKLITEHGSAAILKERIAQLREHVENLQKENDRLQDENRQLENENEDLRQQLEQESVPDQFVKHRGMLFRRLPNGNIQDEVYCPACKIPMMSLEGLLPFRCSTCERFASFTGNDLRRILSEITV